ncbi:MAG: nuclear transport factor 2 family protein [Solirubrobacterales bacterium]
MRRWCDATGKPSRGPRSHRAFGVGDVAGKRGTFRRGLEAFGRRDVEALLRDLDPDVEWHSALPALLGGESTVYRGHQGVRELIRENDEVLAEYDVELSEIRDLGDRVFGIGEVRTRGKGSGIKTESPWCILVEFKDGKGIRIRTDLDPKGGLQAAGLRE